MKANEAINKLKELNDLSGTDLTLQGYDNNGNYYNITAIVNVANNIAEIQLVKSSR